jgi:hypothetical protein
VEVQHQLELRDAGSNPSEHERGAALRTRSHRILAIFVRRVDPPLAAVEPIAQLYDMGVSRPVRSVLAAWHVPREPVVEDGGQREAVVLVNVVIVDESS